MIEQRVMELGERRRITVTIWLSDNQTFTPDDPTWELTQTNQPVADGTCEASADGAKWRLTAEIQPLARGDYRLTYIFGLGTEIIRRSVKIKVV